MISFYLTHNNTQSTQLIRSHRYMRIQDKYAFQLLQFSYNDKKISNSLLYKSSNNNYKLISRNFFMELVNKFWRETIFLSVSDHSSDMYIEQLKSDGLSMYSHDYKNFLSSFSKALINNRIHIKLDFIDNNDTGKSYNNTYTKYIWKKGFNFSWPVKDSYFFTLFKKKFLFSSNNKLVESLSLNKLPVFTVINNLNQIIISESSNEILVSNSIMERLYNIYSKYFLAQTISQIKYQALFFISPNDAQEYRNYIIHKNSSVNNNNLVNLFVTRLDIYYQLMKMRVQSVDFRLIPDLEELGALISHYQYYKNIKCHQNQYFTNNIFQGQPIYFIQPVLAKNKTTGKVELINYNYYNNENSIDSKSKYTAVFMNYKTTILAWQKFKQQMFNYQLPNKPNVMLYNLESFIKEHEVSSDKPLKYALLVPSVESYFYLKKQINLNNKLSIIQRCMNKLSYLKIFSQRIIWSLTSKQPVNL